jgi:hypothetical protein
MRNEIVLPDLAEARPDVLSLAPGEVLVPKLGALVANDVIGSAARAADGGVEDGSSSAVGCLRKTPFCDAEAGGGGRGTATT